MGWPNGPWAVGLAALMLGGLSGCLHAGSADGDSDPSSDTWDTAEGGPVLLDAGPSEEAVLVLDDPHTDFQQVQPQLTVDGQIAIVTLGSMTDPALRIVTWPIDGLSAEEVSVFTSETDVLALGGPGRTAATWVVDGRWLTQAAPSGQYFPSPDLLIVSTDPLTGSSTVVSHEGILPPTFGFGFNAQGDLLDGERLVLGVMGVIDAFDDSYELSSAAHHDLVYLLSSFDAAGGHTRHFAQVVDWSLPFAAGQILLPGLFGGGRTFADEEGTVTQLELMGSSLIAFQVLLDGTVIAPPHVAVEVDPGLPEGTLRFWSGTREQAYARLPVGVATVGAGCWRDSPYDSYDPDRPHRSFSALWSIVVDPGLAPVVEPTVLATTTADCALPSEATAGHAGLAWNGEYLGWCYRDLAPSNRVVFRLLDGLGRTARSKRVLRTLDPAEEGRLVNCDVAALEDGRFLVVFTVGSDLWTATIDPATAFGPGGPESSTDDLPTDWPTETEADTDTGLDSDSETDFPPAQFVRLEPATFVMGSQPGTPGHSSDETPHIVTITRPFWLQSTEVTQWQWASLMGENPSYFLGCGGDCPVEQVSWFEAIVYCNALSAAEGLAPCYADPEDGTPYELIDAILETVPVWTDGLDCPGYRLPTEAEWEYAARGGTTTAFWSGTLAPSTGWGCVNAPNLDAAGWYCDNSAVDYPGCDTWLNSGCNGPHPVGMKLANPFGLFDVHGNIDEFVWDGYAPYSGDGVDPVGSADTQTAVLRGGSYLSFAVSARSAARSESMRGSGHATGLRVARTVVE